MRALFARAALIAAAAGLLMPAPATAQGGTRKALVYCPVGIDETGCTAIVNALGSTYLGGVDKAYDGSGGTVDLATADLGAYEVFVVPSLADDSTAQPYAVLRDSVIAHRLHDVLIGRWAFWSGTPDQGTSNRAEKDALILNLAQWAGANHATVNGPGLVVLLDQSDDEAARYDWVQGLVGVTLVADPGFNSYSSVRTLDAAGAAILAYAGGQNAYLNMATDGFYLPLGAAGVAMSAVGQTGTPQGGQVVLVTSPGANAGTAVIATDKDDYAPGETVTFTGSGFQPGEAVTITLHEDPVVHTDRTISVLADASGAFTDTSFAPEAHDVGVRFIATARGEAGSIAQTTFTDFPRIGGLTIGLQTPSPVTAGNTATYSVSVFRGSNTTATTGLVNVFGLPSGVGVSPFSVSLPAGVSPVTFTLTLSTSPFATAGTYSITVRITSTAGGGSDFAQSGTTLVIAAANTPPVITNVADQTIDEGTTLSLTLQATDAQSPPQTVLFFPQAAPTGVVINPGTGALTWTPTEAQGPGIYTIIYGARDNYSGPGGSGFDADTFTVTVNEVNAAPALGAVGDQSVNEGATLTFTAAASDTDLPAQTLTYSLDAGAPAGASIDPSTGEFSWTPTLAEGPGNYSVTVRVTDNGPGTLSDFETITITVNEVNDEPVFTKGADQTVGEDAPAQSIASWATGIASSAPTDPTESGQALTFVVSNDNNALFSAQPAVAANGTLTFTPAPDAFGSATVSVHLTDDGGTTNGGDDTSPIQTFTITVSAVNDAPSFTKGGDQTVLEDAGAQTVNAWATSISPGPGELTQTVADFATTNDNNALFLVQPDVDPSTGNLTFTPAANANGSATVSLHAIDNLGALSATQQFTITVTAVNDEPVFTKGGDQTVNEDAGAQSVSGWATAISAGPPDENGQIVSFLVSNDNNALFSGQPAVSPAGALTYTPAPNAFGSATVTITAQDDGGTANGGDDTSPGQTFTITVTPVNDPPSFTKGSDQTVNEDAGAQSVSGWATNISPGPGELTQTVADFNVTNDNNVLFSVQPDVDPSTGTLTYTPAPNAFGSATVSIYAVDNLGTLSATEQFTITVSPVNDAPSFTKGADQTLLEDAGAQTVAGWATAIDAGPNESGQSVSFLVSNDNNGLFSAQPAVAANGTLTFTPASNANGSATVTLSVQDDGGTAGGGVDTSAPQTFTITVTPVNDAPAFTKGSDQTVNEDAGAQSVSGWATAISAGPADESGQVLAFTVNNDNTSLFSGQPAIDASGTLTYTPAADAFGTATVSVTLSDNGGTANGGVDASATQQFTITVNAVNDEPSFTKGVDQTVLEDAGPQSVSGWATAISAGPANESGQLLTFNVTGNTSPGLFSTPPAVSASGTLTYTLAPNANGTATITLELQDNGGTNFGGDDTSPPQSFMITVTAVNDAPSYTKGTDPVVNEDSGPFSQTGWATGITAGPTDEAGQVLVFSITGNSNPGLFSVAPSVDPSTGTLTFTPAANANGTASITLRLSDNGGTANGGADYDEQTFTVTVSAVNDEPSFTKGADQTVLEDASAQTVAGWAGAISAGPADESGQVLTFHVSNDNNALFSAQPAVASNGTLTFTPAGDAFGSATVTIYVQDDGGIALGGDDTSPSQTFTITVTPVNDAPSFTKGADQTVLEDAAAQTVAGWATSISAGPTNESGQLVAFTVTNDNAALFSAQPAVAPNGTLTYTLSANANGSATVSVYLTDDGGTANGGVDTSPTQQFTISVTPVNDEPGFTAGNDQTVLEDAPAQTVASWATNISKGPSNESGQTLTFHVSNNNNALFSVQPAVDPTTGNLTYTLATDANGGATVDVHLTDDGGTADGGDDTSPTQSFTITVTAVNDEPTYTKGADQTVAEDAGPQTVSGWATSISAGPPDENGQGLTFTVTGNTNAALFSAAPSVDLTTGTLTYTPAANANGVATITLELSDDGGTANGGDDRSLQTFVITVTPVNDAPVLSDVPPTATIPEEQPYTFDASATDIDLPPDALTFSLVSGPAGASINSSTGVFTWTPTEAQGGSPSTPYAFKVRVTDNGTTNGGADPLSHELDITITVNEINVAPVLGAIGNKSGPWGNAITFTATATDHDDPANTLAFTLDAGAPSGAWIDQTTGDFTWTPTSSQIGSFTITVRVTDNGVTDGNSTPLDDSETITVTVGKRATTLVYNGLTTVQYSDSMGASATLTDDGGGSAQGQPISGKTVTFTLGAQTPTGTTDANGVATSGGTTVTQASGSYTMLSSFAEDAHYLASSDSDPYTITKEDARVEYTGLSWWSTPNSSTATAQVTLRATIYDITEQTGDPAHDAYEGNITNARVTFVNRDAANAAFTGCSNLTPVLNNVGNIRIGTVSCVTTLTAGSTPGTSNTYTVGTVVNTGAGYYTRDAGFDNFDVNVTRGGTGFITGGGFIANQNSGGTYAGEPGAKTNFGFNVKFNKQKTNLQGHVNVIIRRLVSGVWRTYQIKSNSITSLTVQNTTPTTGIAQFVSKANLTDVTDPYNPINLGGNYQFIMTLADNGEPGSTGNATNDRIGLTLWNGSTLLFSSNWNGAATAEQLLTGGNTQVRQ